MKNPKTTRAFLATAKPFGEARNMDGDKERTDTLKLAAICKRDGIVTPFEARFWMSRNADGMAPLHCSVWIRGPVGSDVYVSGYGKASGCGYHKTSAALEAALNAAGFVFEHRPTLHTDAGPELGKWTPWHFGGTGQRAAEDAAEAALRAIGWRGKLATV